VKVTVVAGNPATVPPVGVPTRAADVGLPLAPAVRSIVTGVLAAVVAVSFTATGGEPCDGPPMNFPNATGPLPTGTVVTTVLVAVAITETMLLSTLAT
jgi:hypothetical protein